MVTSYKGRYRMSQRMRDCLRDALADEFFNPGRRSFRRVIRIFVPALPGTIRTT